MTTYLIEKHFEYTKLCKNLGIEYFSIDDVKWEEHYIEIKDNK